MTESEFYGHVDELLGTHLLGAGFEARQRGEYWRTSAEGSDRIMVDPLLRKRQFAVMLCFYPDYMAPVWALIDETGEDRGFPCGPYLTPAGVFQRERMWPAKTPDILRQKIAEIIESLKSVGFPWLEQLRDREFFADSVDPHALLVAAYGNECAGKVGEAAGFYREILGRYLVIIERLRSTSMSTFMKKECVFAAVKLGAEVELRERFQKELSYYPLVKPLLPHSNV